MIQEAILLLSMVVLLLLPELERMGMDILRTVDHMGMGEKSDSAYIKYKQGEAEPF